MAGKKSTAAMEFAIGATIIAGVVVFVGMLMAWGNTTSLLGRHYRVVVNMTNVGMLKEGAPVKMGGFQLGRVATIQLKPGSTKLDIVLDIDEAHPLPKDSTAKVSTAGLVGDAFMEILPGKSQEAVRMASDVAGAEHIQSSPVPDMSEMMAKVASIGEQVNLLTTNLNDIMGDPNFRQSLKSIASNLDSTTYQAKQILQRSQGIINNFEAASKDIAGITGSAKVTLDSIKSAVDSTLGDPEVAKNLSGTIANINSVTGLLAKRNDATEKLLLNLEEMSGDLKAVSARVREITGGIDPATVARTMNSLNSAISSMTGMVEKVKAEPVLALSINKAADRIVKMKFDEMARQRLSSSDLVLDEISRWVREGMDRGVLDDPAYSYEARPYALPEVEAEAEAAGRVPYLAE